MGATFRQDGNSIDHTPSTAKTAGDVVVQGGILGVVTTDIAASVKGSLAITGVYRFTKETGFAVTAGQRMFYDAANDRINVAGTGDFAGLAVLAAGSSDTTVDVNINEGSGGGLQYSATAASTALTNTTTETSFDNSSVVMPANTLNAGDVIRLRAQGICTSTNSTDTLNVKVKIGSTVIAATGAVDVANNDIFFVDVDIPIRTIGASGTLVATGLVGLGVEGTVTAKPTKLASTTIDTTASNTLSVTGTWSVASASNSCRLDVCDVQILTR